MKILFVSELFPYPPERDGARLKTYNLLKYLSATNSIRLISFYENEGQIGLLSEISKFCESVKLVKKGAYSVSGRFGNVWKRYPYSAQIYYNALLHKEIENTLSRGDVDIAHFDSTYMAQYFVNSSVPCVIVPHDCISIQLSQSYRAEKNFFRRAGKWYFYKRTRNLEKDCLGKFDKCIVVAEADKEAIGKFLPQLECVVIPNGIDFEHFRYELARKEKGFNIIFTGNMSALPNYDAAIYFAKEIFPFIRKEIKDAYFYIVGRNPVQAILKLREEDNHIIVTGEVADIREYLGKAHVYACPMRFGSGIKNKLLEAMASGVPIVASTMSVKGSIDVINGEEIFISDDPVDFAGKVVTLSKDGGLREQFAAKSRSLIEEKYSWEGVIKQYIRCYEDAVNQRKNDPGVQSSR